MKMTPKHLLQNLEQVQKLATVPKLSRLLHNPWKYLLAILFRELIHKRTAATKAVECLTFFQTKMTLLLPSGTDIYLTGGKSHDSEIRLAKYLIRQLQPAATFVDVGAHYGYFSLLASELVGIEGNVLALEAAPATYEVLQQNSSSKPTINTVAAAVSDTEQMLTFYEFPNMYSEYNTLLPGQYEDQEWFKQHQPKAIQVMAMPLAKLLDEYKLAPAVIKIDVEGAEYRVIQGLLPHLQDHSPAIVLEYVSAARGNTEHAKAEHVLLSNGYLPHLIDTDGQPQMITSSADHLQRQEVESDNIVFVRSSMST